MTRVAAVFVEKGKISMKITLASLRNVFLSLFLFGALPPALADEEPAPFRVGFAQRDITPPVGIPMWGYGARHDMLSVGTLDPLMAKAIVIEAGSQRLALVGLDLGRGPTEAMMVQIRKEIGAEGIKVGHVLISGSHTHHGPVIELTDEPGFGKGKFDAAVAYSQKLPGMLTEAIREAAAGLAPAKIGVATQSVAFNRNRQSKRTPPATDPLLSVVRFDDAQGKPIAVLVNFAAHPVLADNKVLKYSADFPGYLQKKVEGTLNTHCVFIQGAAGDMSCNSATVKREPEPFGEALADHVIELAGSIKAETPPKPSLAGKVDRFHFGSRTDFSNPLVMALFERAFFPELVHNFNREFAQGIDPELNTVLLNGELAIVGASGEFFCNHANRLRERAYLKNVLFFGYCNGHHMYFPTIAAASEGGYGADAAVSPVELGAGEQMMNRALLNLYKFLGKFQQVSP
jgi:neutral ceramidase